MTRTAIIFTLMSAIHLAGCTDSVKPVKTEYSGSGGMTRWNIDPAVYLYHYQNGFTGSDALGYDEKLQTIWSRLGAALTCNIDYDKQAMIRLLVQRFGKKPVTHELNGIGFHTVQSRKVPGFCNDSRKKEINTAIIRYRQSRFD